MTTAAKIGHGLQFKIGDGASPEVFTAVAEVTGISGVGFSKDEIDVTHTDSANRIREFISGLVDQGAIAIAGNLLASHVTTMEAEKVKTANSNYQFSVPLDTTKTITFSGNMQDFGADAPIGDACRFTATFKVSGGYTTVA